MGYRGYRGKGLNRGDTEDTGGIGLPIEGYIGFSGIGLTREDTEDTGGIGLNTGDTEDKNRRSDERVKYLINR